MTDLPDPSRRRRVRYRGKNPRRFEEKYKELAPEKYPDVVAKVLSSGKTPAGMHRPIMVAEIATVLNPKTGETGLDCTLGYGGHTCEILPLLRPGGRMIGLDVDPIELPKTQQRLREAGFGEDVFVACRSNFAGLRKVLTGFGLTAVDFILADLGVSSMQIDTPDRGFSLKAHGPLDMRMNPNKGQSAADLLARISESDLVRLLKGNADEPSSEILGRNLAGRRIDSTTELAESIRAVLRTRPEDERVKSVRRVFQALRIAVNEELTALDAFLHQLPTCLKPGGRVAILTFHSGEDRRVKKAFQVAFREGSFSQIADEAMRPTLAECRSNPRATSAKLRWARK